MKCYKAKWILTSEDAILENMALIVDEGKIVDIIPHSEIKLEEKFIKDFGNSVITPGFVDLLTQYQYTNIGKIKPDSFKSKLKTLFKTIALKYTFAGVKPDNYALKWASILSEYFMMDRNEKINSFTEGVETSIANGTTCVAQVSKEFKFFDTINNLPIKNYLFFEIYADSSDKSKKQFKEIRAKIEDLILHKGENTHIGIMLNSMSGVHKKLWELFSKYCRKHNMLLMTRFAESQDEIEWLEHGFSDIDLLHKYMGMRKITPYEKDCDKINYLNNLKVLSRKVLVANANYLDEDELRRLSETEVKYIYQPEYSKEICNKKLDLETILKYFPQRFGFSSQTFKNKDGLNLLKIAVDANKDNNLEVSELIKYLTIYPAKILRLDNVTGSIKIGKDADFNVFKLEDNEDYKALVTKEKPYSTYSKGRKLVKRGDIRFSL